MLVTRTSTCFFKLNGVHAFYGNKADASFYTSLWVFALKHFPEVMPRHSSSLQSPDSDSCWSANYVVINRFSFTFLSYWMQCVCMCRWSREGDRWIFVELCFPFISLFFHRACFNTRFCKTKVKQSKLVPVLAKIKFKIKIMFCDSGSFCV